ncbi:SPOR domain-containing protein [Saccharibacter sp. 17.LH.SD]|uniref:SPOR domain-containing protein n=1 Tax=Saccharibacter sp. 17.LH.SD TaxID=2689393 RepID=UPI001371C7AC|nr:SPOR domain-containing protein [Saccharibacter sp. 17.LH.SD]MXV44040.1 SPOR domain-containing protein [Saccharibacter sp. 17.LH.SD]
MPRQDDDFPEGPPASHYGEHLDGRNYADGPRARLGQSSAHYTGAEDRSTRGGGGFLSSLLGHDPVTRKLMSVALAIVVVLLSVLGGWFLLGHKNQDIAVIGPPEFPVKERPADPGGMQIMSDDTANSDVTGKGTVHLAPPPEQPDARVIARREEEDAKAAKAASASASAAQATSHVNNKVSVPQSDVKSTSPAVTSAPSTPPVKQESQSSPGKLNHAEDDASDTDEEPSKKPAKHVVSERPLALKKDGAMASPHHDVLPPPVAQAASEDDSSKEIHGSYQVQLAALDSEAQAAHAWKTFSAKAPDVLTGHQPHYQKIVRNGRMFVRLRVGGFHDLKAARLFCARLHAQSMACSPVAH